jgi:hypothetical protein
MSIVTLFLLRARLRNQGLVPSTSNSRHTRSGSPLRGGSTLMISAPKCLQNQPPQFASLEHARARGAEKATTHPSSWPANGPAMSCPSSRTRTPDSGRLLLDLSFSVALMATPPLSVMGTWLRYGSSAQHLQPAADQGTQRRDPARSVSCWTKSSQHVVMIRKQKTAFVPNCHGYRYVNQSARGCRFYVPVQQQARTALIIHQAVARQRAILSARRTPKPKVTSWLLYICR